MTAVATPSRARAGLYRTLGVSTCVLGCTGIIDVERSAGGGDAAARGGSAATPGETPTVDDEQLVEQCRDAPISAGKSPLRRLTRTQFDNTLRDLLGVDDQPSKDVSPDEKVGPFYANSRTPITELQVQQYQEAAVRIAAEAELSSILPCEQATGDAACAGDLIRSFGARAFRRPLSEDEVALYTQLYEVGEAGGGFVRGARLVVTAMLQSPSFLYHVELGQSDPSAAPSSEAIELTTHELASRLSYFLWDTMPDAELFALADSGQLAEPAVLSSQVTRLLEDPRARGALASFHRQWLAVDALNELSKDADLYPEFDDALRSAMRAEVEDFTDYVIRRGDGRLATLFTAPFSVLDPVLFPLYGVRPPADYVAGEPVALDPTQRSGILTQAAFLSVNAHTDQTSPVHRGLVVRQNFLCETIPPPPPDVDATPPPVSEDATTRERFASHNDDPGCAGCHALMDPIGLGFEHYDAIGRYRQTEGEQPVDATGEIVHAAETDLNGRFYGAVELGHRLSQSPQVAACVASQWFRYALGRVDSRDDACTMYAVGQVFAAADHDVRALITALVTSEAFRRVRLAGSESEQP